MDKLTIMKMYKSGELGPEEKKIMEQYIHDGIIDLDEVEDLHQLHQSIESLPTPEPSEKFRSEFYQMVAAERQKSNRKDWFSAVEEWLAKLMTSPSHQLAYTLGVLAIGIVVGKFLLPASNKAELASLNGEIREMKEVMMMTMLEDVSVTERLKAVSYGNELGADEKVIDALLQALNQDDNVNVRLASLEALEQYVSNPRVREGLIGSIQYQSSPLVQVTLAELIVRMQDVQAAREFKELLDQQEVVPEVKENIVKNLEQVI